MEQDQNLTTENQATSTNASISKEVILWGIAALALAIFSITHNTSSLVLTAGFFAKFFAVIVGTLTGWGGAIIGNALRKFVQPDSVFTSGGFFHLLWLKIFWMLGPQTIGLFIGTFIGCGLVLR